jgi:hypothetical protein
MKNAVFWDDTPCGSCMIRRFRGTNRFEHHDEKNLRSKVHSLSILFTLMMAEPSSSETSVLKRARWCNIPEYVNPYMVTSSKSIRYSADSLL